MSSLQKLVAKRLKMQVPAGPHPEADALTAFAERTLAPQEREAVVAHLSSCSDCREIVFLSQPDVTEMQKVVVPARRHSRFALRWGTLVAAIVVTAVFVLQRDEDRKPAIKQEITAAKQAQNTVASDNEPAQFRAMRQAQSANSPENNEAGRSGRAEPKHMTAKPAVAMNFEESGQVEVAHTPAADTIAEPALKDLAVQERNQQVPAGASSNNIAQAASATGGPIARTEMPGAVGALVGSGTLKKEVLAGGNLAGVVLDSSGAAIPDAKLITVGPVGTRAVTSDREGRFSFDQLPTGAYSVQAVASGFKPTELKQVAVLENKPSKLRLTLTPGAATETVEVQVAAGAVSAAGSRADEGLLAEAKATNALENPAQQTGTATKQKVRAREKVAEMRTALASNYHTVSPPFQWTLSANGQVQRSLDGREWQSVPVPGGSSFRALSARGNDIWIGGHSGLVYHSSDSGENWTRVVPEASGVKLSSDVIRIGFPTLKEGSIESSDGAVWTTSDAGNSWQRK